MTNATTYVCSRCHRAEKQDRSEAQNRLSFLWYRVIGEQTGETEVRIRRECKLKIGVPLLAENHSQFKYVWETLERAHSYEVQLEIMDWLPVTSLFTTKQMYVYLDQMDKTYTMQGVALPYPDDLYQAAMGRVKRNGH
ncbi:hypothetical protein [Porticoccus sp.]